MARILVCGAITIKTSTLLVPLFDVIVPRFICARYMKEPNVRLMLQSLIYRNKTTFQTLVRHVITCKLTTAHG
jgi:hypothetical protein